MASTDGIGSIRTYIFGSSSQGAFPFIWVRFYKQAPGALDVGQQFGRRVEDHDVEEAIPG